MRSRFTGLKVQCQISFPANMKIRLVKTSDAGFKPLMAKILGRRGTRAGDVEQRVDEIVTTVQRQGDRAVLRYTAKFDHIRLRAATNGSDSGGDRPCGGESFAQRFKHSAACRQTDRGVSPPADC